MDVNVLGVLIVAQKRLSVLPAVQTSDFAKRRSDHAFERISLAVSPVGSFDMSRLYLATVVNNGTSGVNERLQNIQVRVTLEYTVGID